MRGVEDEDLGCAYPLGEAGGMLPIPCGAVRRPGSSYCPRHHLLCHIPASSMAECRSFDETEALARVVGGRLGRPAREPPEPLLRRLDRVSRLFSRPHRSRIVHGGIMAKRSTAKLDNPATADLAPTPERQQNGPVERLVRPIADATGHPARPYRAVDTLAVMERRGSITAAMRQAGEDFRARFAVAQLDPLRALDLTHLRVAESPRRPDKGCPRPANRGRAALGLDRHPGGRRHGLAGRLVPVARARLGIAGQGMGLAARLERPPNQPGNRLRHPDRRPRRARIAPWQSRIFA